MASVAYASDATEQPMPARTGARAGLVISALVTLFLAMDAGGKLFAPDLMIANSPAIGLPATVEFYRLLGGILAAATLLYAVPATSVFGAVLLTGYFGGAVATHLIAGSPLLGSTLFGVYLGAAAWLGLWLRMPRLRALFPIMR